MFSLFGGFQQDTQAVLQSMGKQGNPEAKSAAKTVSLCQVGAFVKLP